MQQLQNVIETAFERRADITPANVDTVTREAVNQVISLLDSGALRVAEKIDGQWVTHQWLKKAVLLSFRINDNQVIDGAESRYFDKVPMKFADYDEARFQKEGFRVVPPAAVRQGAFIARNTVLMPSYVNIGAYVDEGTMVDTWATVGSCAQIGKNVHPYWSRCRLTQPSLKTTALLARVLRSWKASLSKKVPSFPWAYTSARVPKSTIAKPVKFTMAAYRRAPWSFPATCRQKTVSTACTAR